MADLSVSLMETTPKWRFVFLFHVLRFSCRGVTYYQKVDMRSVARHGTIHKHQSEPLQSSPMTTMDRSGIFIFSAQSDNERAPVMTIFMQILFKRRR